MADRPRTGDDDEGPRPPEVTVPPWLRSGPTPEHAIPGVTAADRSAGAATGPDVARAAAREQDPPGQAPPPNRITLGAAGGSARPGARSVGSGGPPPAEYPVGPPGSDRLPSGDSDRTNPYDSGRTAPSDADGLSTLSLGAPVAVSNRPDDPEPASRAVVDRRPARIALLVAAGVAVLGGSAVLGYVIARGAVSPVAEQDSGCVEVSEPGRVVGSGPGSLETPAGAVLAFDHAYYVERSVGKAFEAVAPSSRMTEEQLRVEGVEQVPEGTTHCVELRELSPTLLEVDLTEYPPEAAPVLIRQRVRVAENADGTWGIVSITPAG
ncbi:hypothetical protein [Dietzia sp. ANT_WB102]|uniref:hypothetical protein n=1 Tax=Dietzia sp. ANT_WB102 TaxID=2597345 RepID=UPI0011EC8646|nr:hypothetical protein [Dietzia sp. ANT_WB102]KAA0918124.1 hypothetical protein FQ137_01680 [Dietzia sp. ANT_WB102]